MLTFMNSKLTKMTGKDKQNHIFQKSKSYEISSTVIYISKDQKFIIRVFYWCIPLDHEIYLVPKTLDFSQNYFVPFHRFTFDHSISCVLLIDKPNESCQNSKKFKRNAISTTKKSF